jgi:hypothetical protein
MITYELRTLRCEGTAVRKIEKKLRETKTPIEQIFYDIIKREMTVKERRILLRLPKKTNKPK